MEHVEPISVKCADIAEIEAILKAAITVLETYDAGEPVRRLCNPMIQLHLALLDLQNMDDD